MSISAFIVAALERLVITAIAKGTGYAVQEYFTKRRAERAVETAASNVAETLVSFFQGEGVPEDHQKKIIEECCIALSPLSENSSPLFQGSLNPQIIYDNAYKKQSDVPKNITEDGLQGLYEMAFIRIASLLCVVPPAIKDWEANAWSESYRRLDQIIAELKAVFSRVDAMRDRLGSDNDTRLRSLRRYLAQRIAVDLDITGLRADAAVTRAMEDMFVHPSISQIAAGEDLTISVATDQGYIEQFAGKSSRSLVYGAPGSGKSTWSRWLQRLALAEHWGGLVVRIEMKTINLRKPPSLAVLLRQSVGPNYAEQIDAALVEKLVKDGMLLVIFDGFDEIGPNNRDKAIEWIEEGSTFAEACPVAITSRTLSTDHLKALGDAWSKWTVEPFDVPRIVEYITRWYNSTSLPQGTEAPDAVQLADKWRADNTISPLTGNPLLLSTLLMVHLIDGDLPAGRAELYDRYVKGMCGVWDARRKVEPEPNLTPEVKRAVLAEVALEMLLRGEEQLDEKDAKAAASKALKRLRNKSKPLEVLERIRERTGLLAGPGIYTFSHRTIGEFLVAEIAVEGDRELPDGARLDAFKLFELRDRDEWNTVLFLWAGLAPVATVEQFVRECARVAAAEIAFGLLLDQYYRFSADVKKKLIDLLRPVLNGMDFDDKTNWVVGALLPRSQRLAAISQSVEYMLSGRLIVPNATVRGITGRSQGRLRTLLEQLIEDGFVSDDYIKKLDGHARQIAWMTAVTRTQSVTSLRKLLGGIPFEGSLRLRWLYWVIESRVGRTWTAQGFAGKVIPANDIIREVVSLDRRLEAVVPIAIMSVALRRAEWIDFTMPSLDQQPHFAQRIAQESAWLLMQTGNSELKGEYLLATKYWTNGDMGRPAVPLWSSDADLLKTFDGFVAMFEKDDTPDRVIGAARSWIKGATIRRDGQTE